MLFTQKGVSYEATVTEPGEPPVSGEISLDLTYLEVPVLLRADLGQAGGAVRPFVLAGPVVSYQTGCSIGFEVGEFSESDDCDADGDAEINKLDVGGTVGGGLAFLLGSREVTAGVRYTQGFRNLGKDGPDAKNQNFSVLFGIAF